MPFIAGAFFAAIIGYCFCCTVLIAIVGIPTLQARFRPRPNMDFDADRWKSATFESGLRYPMAEDLARTGRLLGLDRESLLSILGPANRHQTNGNQITFFYELASQSMYPSRTWFLPWIFSNTESWVLQITLTDGKVENCQTGGS